MYDGEEKDIVFKDHLIRTYSTLKVESLGCDEDQKISDMHRVLKVESLGCDEDQKISDMHRVSQNARTLARLVIEAGTVGITLDDLVKPENFELVVRCTKALSVDKE